ncbi:NAD(P)/FAD-dependent oxidoreductase [Magnetospirillum gryphiswaldense]|uniref:Ferredoxin--NADP reductase n=1 Tax=Magnetospirillum gryphiswaldense TaxID=55518 RepID=A4U356_9PROT|nr:NAD(P)/FAD-dependent oxidoreductase [Magnetospirillum gryphiswaldense]AVM75833.1 Ferredoxin--NADP reductase [Magnetospirillum gryphiswaldense MSR-1]AVM79736.1 Ferredoxin--NADP reductase [Magnetospirillum gryphiswaldense]CAM77313.1 FAD-dependent pyridine nucleotide-disulphide oxidoreductase [Magnetospirillum gryphiswaldense MSR-1]
MKHETDVVVVGAGPAGLFAVFQCGMVRLKCHVVDALDAVGGQCAALYPEKPIYDVPAQPSILAADLIDQLQAQAAPFSPTYHLGRQMTGLDKAESGWRCSLSDGTEIMAKVVIVAAGSGAFGPNRPPLDGLQVYEGQGQGRGVNYFVTRREDFRGKKVVIAGGGDSAVDWAISLSELAASVQVVHRRPKFRAAPESEAKLKAQSESGKIELVVPYQLHGLGGANGQLHSVIVATLDGQTRTLAADVLLPFFGLATELGPIAQWGLAMDKNVISVDPASMQTSVPGIFAAGDICTYPGKLKLILSGFAEAARAAHSAYEAAHPGEALHFEHSTSMGAPGK